MGRFACVVFELDDNQKLEDLLNHIEKFAPRLGYTAKQVMKKQAVSWEMRYKEIMRRLGVPANSAGYCDLKVVIECLHKTPNAKLNYIYTMAEKESKRPESAIVTSVRSLTKKVEFTCGAKGIEEALGIELKENMKITNKNFIYLLHDAVFEI